MMKNKKIDNFYKFKNRVDIWIKESLPESINLIKILSQIDDLVPFSRISVLESIYIGQFSEFNERDIRSFYKSGTIYLTNKQESSEQLSKDLLHEIAHLLEDDFGMEIYSDGEIEKEFLSKRMRVYFLLKDSDYNREIPSMEEFMNIAYSKEFDMFLYKELGYDGLGILTANLFINPYSVTSMREYFACGFENFFTSQSMQKDIKTISPALFYKISNIKENFDEN